MQYVDLVDYNQKLEANLQQKVISENVIKGFLRILDFMLINEWVAWNMALDVSGIMKEKEDNLNWKAMLLC